MRRKNLKEKLEKKYGNEAVKQMAIRGDNLRTYYRLLQCSHNIRMTEIKMFACLALMLVFGIASFFYIPLSTFTFLFMIFGLDASKDVRIETLWKLNFLDDIQRDALLTEFRKVIDRAYKLAKEKNNEPNNK